MTCVCVCVCAGSGVRLMLMLSPVSTREVRIPYIDPLLHAGVVPSGTFKSKEGKYVVIGGNGERFFLFMC